jgi:hypothetical protein
MTDPKEVLRILEEDLETLGCIEMRDPKIDYGGPVEPQIKTAEDAKKLTTKSKEGFVMPALKKIRWAIERACKQTDSRLTYETKGIPFRVQQTIADHLKRQGFEVKIVSDQRNGTYFDIKW